MSSQTGNRKYQESHVMRKLVLMNFPDQLGQFNEAARLLIANLSETYTVRARF